MDVLYGQRTSFPKKKDLRKEWVLIDAHGMVAGRLASKIAFRLQGKHLPSYAPGFLSGDCVVVINADQVSFTGSKIDKKEYRKHSGYFGGLKTRKLKDIEMKEALYLAIKGMLPKTKVGKKLATRLRIFSGTEHKMEAQMPTPIKV